MRDPKLRPELPEPAFYFPPASGRYTTTPDLFGLTARFGNGPVDTHLFQLDNQFARFQHNKREIHEKHPDRAILSDDFSPDVSHAVCSLMILRLATEHPDHFQLEPGALICRLTGETLCFDRDLNLLAPDGYKSAFDAICCQIQEDIAIVRTSVARGDWNAALHVCASSRWDPREKIGRSYSQTHEPVPGVERSRAAAPAIVKAMVERGPFVRFNWGLAFDTRLDLHPENVAPRFDGENLWLRVERQTLWPLPQVAASLFAIRVHLYDIRDICRKPGRRESLRAALFSMSPESRAYKGIASEFDAVVNWLDSLNVDTGS